MVKKNTKRRQLSTVPEKTFFSFLLGGEFGNKESVAETFA
jgi:hypothetical protein